MIEPTQVMEMLGHTLTLTPTSTTTATPTSGPVKPIPTVIPTPPEYQLASDSATRALWVAFAIMALSGLASAVVTARVPVPRRLYHFVATTALVVSALAYLGQASGQGRAVPCVAVADDYDKIPVDTRHDVCRQVSWARHVDWALTLPLQLLVLSVLAGADGARTLAAAGAGIVLPLAGLFSALRPADDTPARWSWYVIAWVAWVVAAWQVGLHGSRAVRAKGRRVSGLFGSLGVFALLQWAAYAVIWGVANGSRKMSVDGEITAYIILDILAKPVFFAWLLLGNRALPESSVEVGGYWSQGLAPEGRIRIGDDEDA